MNIFTQLRIRIRERLNPLFAPIRRSKISAPDTLTIISNNCWGGHVYRYFGIQYNSPTVGMYFYAEDYIKFLSNLKYYLGVDMKMISPSESIHYEDLKKNHQESLDKPIGRIDDVEIVFLHCHSNEEALTKWNRRKARMDLNNLVVKMSEMNGCSEEHLRLFDALPYKRKFVFTTKDYGLKSQVIYKEWYGKDEIKNDTTDFRKYVNLENWINGKPFIIKR
jgi:uncharacterized protein (DUF1919 family)